MAISSPSKDKGCSGIQTPHDDGYSFDFDGVIGLTYSFAELLAYSKSDQPARETTPPSAGLH